MKTNPIAETASFQGPDPDRLQQMASDPTASVWVAASAGSGKTTILVKRVLRLLLVGSEPQKILCLTYTRAAAAEMAVRLSGTLSKWATGSDNELSEAIGNLQEAPATKDQMTVARRLFARTLSCPGGMRIRTIHSFCQEILRRFPIEAGLPPHFEVGDEADMRALEEDVRNEMLREAAAEPESAIGKALARLVHDLGEFRFEEALRAVRSDRARLEDLAAKGIEKVFEQTRNSLQLAPGETAEELRKKACSDRVLPREDMLAVARRLQEEGSKSHAKRGTKMLIFLALPDAERASLFDDWCRCLLTAEGEPYKSYADKKLNEKYPDLDPVQKREANRLRLANERIEAAEIADTTQAILTLGLDLLRRFQTAKLERAVLDYDDLIIRTDRLLHRPGIAPWVLFKLDGGLDHILVDEAQDTSRLQWNIVAALAEEFFAGSGARADDTRTLFVVGDEKQSIFSFQHADPESFARMRDFFAQRITDADRTWRPLPLHVSFRSAPAILRSVDAVFAKDEARHGVSSQPVQHYPVRKNEKKLGRVEVWPLIEAPEKTDLGTWELPLDYEPERDPQAELATSIATRIAEWLRKGEKLPGAAQPIVPGDIMILLRKRGRFADLMVRALKEAGVPVTGVDRMHLVEQLPVMDLCALMQFALLPEDDLNLATVLRSPLLGLSEDQLMTLAIGRNGSLWHALRGKAAMDPAFARADEYLAAQLAAADFETPLAMLMRMLDDPCPGNASSGRKALWSRLGPDALDPIEELLNAAQGFEHRHVPSLQSFLHWLFATEAEIKRELDRGGGQVRIMTVHASKGLEAPIVFLPDTAGVPDSKNTPKLLWDEKTGAPLYLIRRPQSGSARTLWQEARQLQLQEYRRLLYVALTRAIDRLYIGGWASPRAGNAESWYALASEGLRPHHTPSAVEGEESIVIADEGIPEKTEEKPAIKSAVIPPLPAWAQKPAPFEDPTPRPIAPSRLAAEAGIVEDEPPAALPDQRFARGRIIHRLLESLPDVADERREKVAERFLANPQHRLSPKDRKEIAGEVLRLLRDPEYSWLFGPDSRAEVSLAGFMDGKLIAGQVDRFGVRDKDVWILDYKSNRPPPLDVEDAPKAYLKQLSAYASVLRDVYPGKTIRCFLLWTYAPRLMPVPERLLGDA